jgi:hypothetical protein
MPVQNHPALGGDLDPHIPSGAKLHRTEDRTKDRPGIRRKKEPFQALQGIDIRGGRGCSILHDPLTEDKVMAREPLLDDLDLHHRKPFGIPQRERLIPLPLLTRRDLGGGKGIAVVEKRWAGRRGRRTGATTG